MCKFDPRQWVFLQCSRYCTRMSFEWSIRPLLKVVRLWCCMNGPCVELCKWTKSNCAGSVKMQVDRKKNSKRRSGKWVVLRIFRSQLSKSFLQRPKLGPQIHTLTDTSHENNRSCWVGNDVNENGTVDVFILNETCHETILLCVCRCTYIMYVIFFVCLCMCTCAYSLHMNNAPRNQLWKAFLSEKGWNNQQKSW